MKNNIKIFEHAELGDIRVIQGEDNEPWFAAKDICETLGFTRPSDALRGLDSDVDLLKWEESLYSTLWSVIKENINENKN